MGDGLQSPPYPYRLQHPTCSVPKMERLFKCMHNFLCPLNHLWMTYKASNKGSIPQTTYPALSREWQIKTDRCSGSAQASYIFLNSYALWLAEPTGVAVCIEGWLFLKLPFSIWEEKSRPFSLYQTSPLEGSDKQAHTLSRQVPSRSIHQWQSSQSGHQ